MKYKVMEHARTRYNTMSQRERFLRVGKMAQLEKLEAFLLVARENNNRMLADLVKSRIEQVKSFNYSQESESSTYPMKESDRMGKEEGKASERVVAKPKSPVIRDKRGNEEAIVTEYDRDIVL